MISLVRSLLIFDLVLAFISLFFLLRQRNIATVHKWLFSIYLFGAFIWIGGVLGMFYFPSEILYTAEDKLVYFFSKMAFCGPLILFPAELLFIATYPDKKFRLGSYLNLFPLALALILLVANAFDNTIFLSFYIREAGYIEGTLGPFLGLFTVFIFTYYIFLFTLILKKRKQAKNNIIKKQFQYLFYSFLVFGGLGWMTNWILPVFMNTPYLSGFGPLTFVFVVLSFCYSVTHHRFMDIKLMAHEYSTYIINTAFYIFPIGLTHRVFGNGELALQYYIPLMLTLFVVSLLLWNRTLPVIEKALNYLFYRRSMSPIQDIKCSLKGFQNSISYGLNNLAKALQVKNVQFAYAHNHVNLGQNIPLKKNTSDFKHFVNFFVNNPSREIVKDEIKYELIKYKSITKKRQNKVKIKKLMEKYMLAAAIPVLDDNKKLLGILFLEKKIDGSMFSSQEIKEIRVLLSDATIYFIKEHNYEKLKKKFEDKKHVKKEFISGLMHEVRTHLTLVSSVKDLIEWEKLKPENKKYLDKAQDAVFDLTQSLQRMSSAFYWQNDLCSLEVTKTSLNDLIQYALNHLETEYPLVFSQTEVKTKRKSYLPEEISIDLYQLREAFGQIIKNGLFFNDKAEWKKQVTIKIDKQGKYYVIDFTDNGIGIEKKYWYNIFELLHVLSYSRNRSECGLGIGLTFAKGVIEAHKGSIEVLKSEVNKGTTFRVLLPLSSE